MMTQLRIGFTSKAALLFIALNLADIALTVFALSLGSRELNYVYSSLGSPALLVTVKMLTAGIVVLGLGVLNRSRLLSWVNIGMVLIVIWNVLAVLSWSV